MRKNKSNNAGAAALSGRASPSFGKGWKTTDEDEVARRAERAREEKMTIENIDTAEPFFSTFIVVSDRSGAPYAVEVRSLAERLNSCTCTDFRINGLGTCKHVEAVINELSKDYQSFEAATKAGSGRAEVFLRRAGAPQVRIELPRNASPVVADFAQRFFDDSGALRGWPAHAVPALERALEGLPKTFRRRFRVAVEVREWAEDQSRKADREKARKAFERDVEAGRRTFDLLRQPLYPYQREGMLHLAFGERAMLVDDMGLGKTVQAIAACALLNELRGIKRVLVVSPASLKTEWEEQIARFTDLKALPVFGALQQRMKTYREDSFFYLTNYEQVLNDVANINQHLAPDVVILDEAQRIKNWTSKTAQAVKRLESSFAFVLTGTPLENRIDEVYSIVQFLDPHLFGPLFRFNREFYVLDERGRPAGYKNLDELRRRLRPIMLRRRKDEVEGELPGRVDNNYFVDMSPEQRAPYEDYQRYVTKMAAKAAKMPLTREEHEMMMRWLACMRMLCDTTFILDPDRKVSPKIDELGRVLEDLGVRDGPKALVFSEWERMLFLARDLADGMGIGYAWHTGSVPQRKRREEINRFKNDPACRLFLSTDSGGVGLNLQAASVVVNLDLPWNPARLEQRIARAWRKHQKNPVQVVNMITKGTIEHRMLDTIAVKRDLAAGIIDGRGDLSSLKMASSRQAFLDRLKVLMGSELATGAPADGKRPLPADAAPAERFRQGLLAELSGRVKMVESRAADPGSGAAEGFLVVVDDDGREIGATVRRIHAEAFAGRPAGTVEVLDRRTFETLRRLSGLGWIRPAPGPAADLHREEGFRGLGPDAAKARRARAACLANEAGRKLRIGALLAEGGFPGEALAPATEAAESALAAFAALAGYDETAGGPVPHSFIVERVVPAGLVSAQDWAAAEALRAASRSPGTVDKKSARSRLDECAALVEKLNSALQQAGA